MSENALEKKVEKGKDEKDSEKSENIEKKNRK